MGTETPRSELMTMKETAAELRVQVRSVYRWMDDPAMKFPRPVMVGRRPRFVRSEIAAWWAGRRAAA